MYIDTLIYKVTSSETYWFRFDNRKQLLTVIVT